jgi:hypothetical protein
LQPDAKPTLAESKTASSDKKSSKEALEAHSVEMARYKSEAKRLTAENQRLKRCLKNEKRELR